MNKWYKFAEPLEFEDLQDLRYLLGLYEIDYKQLDEYELVVDVSDDRETETVLYTMKILVDETGIRDEA